MLEKTFPIWRQRLVRSLHVNRSQVQSKFYQVASVCEAGKPKNRTMVFRGFHSQDNALLSVTDLRSEKLNDWIGNRNDFEICWYFAKSREQFRIAGKVFIVSSSQEETSLKTLLGEQSKEAFLRQQWSNLSLAGKQQFYWPTPKAPCDEIPEATTKSVVELAQSNPTISESHNSSSEKSKTAENVLEMNVNFCVAIFIPFSVDYLNLKPKPQQRSLYALNDSWAEHLVNP